ncbi:MAG: ribbon-helix-helix domain-containing protein, partial [Pseudomonadota bacterium]
ERFCMGKNFQSVGVTLSPRIIDQVDRLAEARGVSRSEAIRISVDVGIPLLQLGLALNTERALTILEHTQLALSLLVERQYPEDVNELINQALANVRDYHA